MLLSSMWEIADRSNGVADGLRTGETQRNQQVIPEKFSGHFENISWRYSVSLLGHYYQWVRAGGLVIKHKGLVSPPLSTLEMDRPSRFSSQKSSNRGKPAGSENKIEQEGKTEEEEREGPDSSGRWSRARKPQKVRHHISAHYMKTYKRGSSVKTKTKTKKPPTILNFLSF